MYRFLWVLDQILSEFEQQDLDLSFDSRMVEFYYSSLSTLLEIYKMNIQTIIILKLS